MAAAADVPYKFDVVIDGKGYRFWDGAPGGERATYAFTPTFVPRTNVEGDYGDSQQEFWLTWTQRDWSVGEKLKFSRQNDGQSRMFWRGSNIDVRTPGQVTLRRAITTFGPFAEAVSACAPYANPGIDRKVVAAGPTKLWFIDASGTISDGGAHGLSATPSSFALTSDGGGDMYVSTTASGTVGVRKRDVSGGAYSTFSATGSDALAYLNNTLYGLRATSAGVQSLIRYDTAGTVTTLYTWKQADGGDGVYAPTANRLEAFGGKLFITWIGMNAEMWMYDGAGVQMVASLPGNFYPHDTEVLFGIPFVSGVTVRNVTNASTFEARPAIYYYNGGQVSLLWQADDYVTGLNSPSAIVPAVVAFDTGLVFNDDTTGRLMFYDITTGGVHAIGSYTVAGNGPPLLAATNSHFLLTRGSTTAYMYPDLSTIATTGFVQGALIDFNSSLDKLFRGIKVDYDEGAGGDGGSVDIAYRLADVDGAYTTLQTGAVSGTEYPLTGVTGRSMSIKVTLNKGTSTTGPVVKRVYLRAAPVQFTFRRQEYRLELSGRNGQGSMLMRDGTPSPKDGLAMAVDLRTAATMSTPVTITDRFGTFTGILEADKLRIVEVGQEEFYADVAVREV